MRRLENLVDKSRRMPGSFLRWAELNDVERLRELSDAGLLRTEERKFETYEYGPIVEMAAVLVATVQGALSDGGKRPKVIAPRTAMDVLDEETRAAKAEALEEAAVYLSDEDYLALSSGGDAAGGFELTSI